MAGHCRGPIEDAFQIPGGPWTHSYPEPVTITQPSGGIYYCPSVGPPYGQNGREDLQHWIDWYQTKMERRAERRRRRAAGMTFSTLPETRELTRNLLSQSFGNASFFFPTKTGTQNWDLESGGNGALGVYGLGQTHFPGNPPLLQRFPHGPPTDFAPAYELHGHLSSRAELSSRGQAQWWRPL